MQYIAELPFSLGDSVWVAKVGNNHYEHKCSTCVGHGILSNVDGDSIRCPDCVGRGTRGHTKREWLPEEKKIESVFFLFNRAEGCIVDRIEFTSETSDHDGYPIYDFTEDVGLVFPTLDDCALYCEDRNLEERQRRGC